jgi:hypothetical protein
MALYYNNSIILTSRFFEGGEAADIGRALTLMHEAVHALQAKQNEKMTKLQKELEAWSNTMGWYLVWRTDTQKALPGYEAMFEAWKQGQLEQYLKDHPELINIP